jgi:adenylosuccinate lyase
MSITQVTALSPLDGRYAAKLSALRPLMSEQGYMHRRVQVEIAWFIALSDAGFDEFKTLSALCLHQRRHQQHQPRLAAQSQP